MLSQAELSPHRCNTSQQRMAVDSRFLLTINELKCTLCGVFHMGAWVGQHLGKNNLRVRLLCTAGTTKSMLLSGLEKHIPQGTLSVSWLLADRNALRDNPRYCNCRMPLRLTPQKSCLHRRHTE